LTVEWSGTLADPTDDDSFTIIAAPPSRMSIVESTRNYDDEVRQPARDPGDLRAPTMAKKPLGKPPSQRPGHRPGRHRQKPLDLDGLKVDVAYVRTVSAKSPEPVVLLINLDDEIGGKLGRQILGSQEVAETIKESRNSPYAPSLTLGIDSDKDATSILHFVFENAPKALETPVPAGHYRVVIVDGGEMMCRSRPVPDPGIIQPL
jgi:hypothetical protein